MAKEVHYKKFDASLGFFFARVLDNKITRSIKNKKEYESAIIRAVAFMVVTQIFVYIISRKECDKNRLGDLTFQNNKEFQSIFDDLASYQIYDPIFNTRIVELLPPESISTLNNILKRFLLFHELHI